MCVPMPGPLVSDQTACGTPYRFALHSDSWKNVQGKFKVFNFLFHIEPGNT